MNGIKDSKKAQKKVPREEGASSVYKLLTGEEYFNQKDSHDPLNFIRSHGLENTLHSLTKNL